jgi:hypothetical protein
LACEWGSSANKSNLDSRSDAPSASVPDDFAEHARLMTDLMALAFQTDMTRVVAVLLALEQSPRNYPEIGITEGHHGLTHHQGDTLKIEKVTQINEYHIQQFAYLLDKFKSIRDGDGTLRPGRHVSYSDETPMANFFLSMLDRMGVPADKWGDSTGRLEGLSDL